MSTLTAHLPTNDQENSPAPPDIIGAREAAALRGVKPKGLYYLVRKGKVPPPISNEKPLQWSRSVWMAWMASILTVAGHEEANPGWVWVQNSGVRWQTIARWIKRKLLKKDVDYKELESKIKRNGRQIIWDLVFVRKQAIADLRASSTDRRSKAVEEGWAKTGMFSDGNRTLLRARGVLDLIENTCGGWKINLTTLLRWSNILPAGNRKGSEGREEGCTYRDGEPLTVAYRDKDNQPTLSTDKDFRCWFHSEIEEVCLEINKLRREPKHADLYTIEQTSLLTLVPQELLLRNKVTEPMGLVREEKPVKYACKRQKHYKKSKKVAWTIKTRRRYFTKTSVDRFVAANPHLEKLCLLKQAAETLEISAQACRPLCRERLLECERAYVDILPTKKSVAAAKTILDEVGGDFKKLVAKLKEARDKRTAQAALPALPKTVAPSGNGAQDGPAPAKIQAAGERGNTNGAATAPTMRSNGSAGVEAPQENARLTDRQLLILETILAREATSRRAKATRSEIVRLINPKHSPQNYNHDFASLKTGGYTDSERGPDGGVWLTARGIQAAKDTV